MTAKIKELQRQIKALEHNCLIFQQQAKTALDLRNRDFVLSQAVQELLCVQRHRKTLEAAQQALPALRALSTASPPIQQLIRALEIPAL